MYRTLDANKIVETLERLKARIAERFPDAGLGRVCNELLATARQSRERAEAIAKPDVRLRVLVAIVLTLGALLLVSLGGAILADTRTSNDLFGTLEGIDSAFNLVVLMGASLFFMVSLEDRLKRKRALDALHELRSIIHVIDMHQLTKDPSASLAGQHSLNTSPARTLPPFELMRYLDYCSEMLSLASKVAVLYSQSLPDAVVTEVVNDLERTASSLSQKIWQKINILHRSLESSAAANRTKPDAPAPVSGPAQADKSV